MIAAGAKADTFTWWSRNLKLGFRLQSPGLWGKQVNLTRDERGLQYLYHNYPRLHERQKGGCKEALDSLEFGNLKNVFLLVSNWQNKISPLLAPLEKCL